MDKIGHKIGSRLLLLVTLFLFVACHSGYSVPADKVRIRIEAEPATLNPITASDAYESQVNGYVFDSLIDRNRDTLEFEPKIAKSWTISEDKLIYTFNLRDDVKWHDGEPLTADDVVYSYNLINDPKVNTPQLKVYFQDVESVQKLDQHTVQFKYRKVYFLGFSVCGFMPIMPKHIIEKYDDFEASEFSRHPIGSGPYKFKEWLTNTRIVLVRNEDYWDKKPAIREIEFKIIADAAISLQILKKGEIDVFSLSNIQWAKQTGSEKFNQMFGKYGYPTANYGYIGWNNANPIFQDKRVRRAMTHMIDRKKINEKLEFNLGRIVTGPFFPFSKQYNNSIEPFEYNVQKAKDLLSEVGWSDHDGDGILDKDGKKFEFSFLYPAGAASSARVVTILKEELKKIGIILNINRLEWAAFLDKINKREIEATMLGWASPYESDPYQVWDISQADKENSSNFIAYRSQEASDLIHQARVEFDEDKRNALYWKFQEILHEDQPYTFLFNRPALVVVSRRFDHVIAHKTGLNLLEWEIKK